MNLGAFGVLILLARRGEELNDIQDLQGLYERQPAVAIVMAIFMLSLAGIPPTAGFMGKFYIFIAAVHAHQYALAVIGLLASVIGVFYYLRVIISMFFQPARREFPTHVWSVAPGALIALVISAFFTLFLGVSSSGFYNIAKQGADSLNAPVPVAAVASASAPLQKASLQ
jgi:NADH-quinone oxidoreductase subunit N